MPSIAKLALICLTHFFYKIKIHCACSKCCESDCVSQTDNISLDSKKDEQLKNNISAIYI